MDHNHLTLRGGPVGVMLRDRYDPYSLFDAVPQLQLRFEPELAAADRLLRGLAFAAAPTARR